MIVVLDASVVVSAALKVNGIPEQVLLRAVTAPHRVILSPEVEAEYRDVLFRPKFDRFVHVERRRQILDIVSMAAAHLQPSERVRICYDPDDDKYLELAAAGRADMIVAGDARHLLPLHPWCGIRILLPAAALSML